MDLLFISQFKTLSQKIWYFPQNFTILLSYFFFFSLSGIYHIVYDPLPKDMIFTLRILPYIYYIFTLQRYTVHTLYKLKEKFAKDFYNNTSQMNFFFLRKACKMHSPTPLIPQGLPYILYKHTHTHTHTHTPKKKKETENMLKKKKISQENTRKKKIPGKHANCVHHHLR